MPGKIYLTRNPPLVIIILLFLQRVLLEIILWRVPTFRWDAEGLERNAALFLQQAFDISGTKDRVN